MFGRKKRNEIYDRLLSPVLLTQQLLLNNEYAEKLLDQVKIINEDGKFKEESGALTKCLWVVD